MALPTPVGGTCPARAACALMTDHLRARTSILGPSPAIDSGWALVRWKTVAARARARNPSGLTTRGSRRSHSRRPSRTSTHVVLTHVLACRLPRRARPPPRRPRRTHILRKSAQSLLDIAEMVTTMVSGYVPIKAHQRTHALVLKSARPHGRSRQRRRLSTVTWTGPRSPAR